MLNWLKRLLARTELDTLERYRYNVYQLDRWFAGNDDGVVMASRWLREYSEPVDDPHVPPSGWGIMDLRDAVLRAASSTRAELTALKLDACSCRWDADDNRATTCDRHQGWLDVIEEWSERAKAAERTAMRVVPPGMALVPDYRGFAHLGLGEYVVNHSAEGSPAELVISIATDADKAVRSVGDDRINEPNTVIRPEAMAARIRFANEAGLAVLEKQLDFVRAVHFSSVAPAATATRLVSPAGADIIAERARQVDGEGWTQQHDDEHDAGELAGAAAAYAAHASDALHPQSQGDAFRDGTIPPGWCWEPSAWKPGTARRNLVKAGALILAEIERIDRTGDDAPAPEDESDYTCPPEILQVILVMVGLEPSLETIATWSTTQCKQAQHWAATTHFRASDNDVEVPPRPDFLPQAWQGPDLDTGDVFGGRQPTRF